MSSLSRLTSSRVLRAATASVAALALLLSGSLSAAADADEPTSTASVSGVVTAQADGSPVGGATVVLRNEAGDPAGEVTATGDGSYEIAGVVPGVYTVEVTADGFESGAWVDPSPTADGASLPAKTTDPSTSVETSDPAVIGTPDESPADPAVSLVARKGSPLTLAAGQVRDKVDVALASSAVPSDTTGSSGADPGSPGTSPEPSIQPGAPEQPAPAESQPATPAPVVSPTSTPTSTPMPSPTPTETRSTSPRAAAPMVTTDATPGSITGKVTRASDGTPLANVSVSASSVSGGSWGWASTDATGAYAITGLVPGTYTVSFSSQENYVDQVWNNKPSGANTGDVVTVAAGAATPGINAAMVVGGQISGTVTRAAGGAPVGGVSIWAQGTAGYRSATSNPDGTYTVGGLPTGSYTVSFSPSSDLVAQDWNNKPSGSGMADSVAVTLGKTASGINAALVAAGSISGVVTRASDGQPVEGVSVQAVLPFSSGLQTSFYAQTDATGTYTIAGLAAGTYTVNFGGSGDLMGQSWNNKPYSYGGGDPIVLATGQGIVGVNAALTTGGTITGTVTGAADGKPIVGIYVSAYSGTSPGSAGVTTDANGNYTISGLATDAYAVNFTDDNNVYVGQYWNNEYDWRASDKVTVTAGQTAAGINATMVKGGSITGKVTRASDGNPVGGISVSAYPTAGGGSTPIATTAADGTYTISALRAGTYQVYFHDSQPGQGLVSQYWNNKTGATADTVTVAAGATVTGINAVMVKGGSITGKVVAGGVPMKNVSVSALTADGSGYGFTTTAADGTYSITGLPAGAYQVYFEPGPDAAYAGQYWTNATTPTNATSVTVALAQTVSGIDATLVKKGTITGKIVSAADNTPLAGVDVSASSTIPGAVGWGTTKTDANGNYSLLVAPGSYSVSFRGAADYATQYWKGATRWDAATPVTVTSNTTTSGINAQLLKKAAVSGKVSGLASGAGTKVYVYFLDANAQIADGVGLNADGTFSGLVAPGTYRVQVADYSSTYGQQFYGGVGNFDQATPVTLTPGGSRSGLDFSLAKAVKVAGNVGASAALDPTAPWATITAYQWGSDSAWHQASRITGWGDYAFSTTNMSAWGENPGLAAGTYTVGFSAVGFCDQFFNGKTTLAGADKFSLAAGASKPGVNATLQKNCAPSPVTAGLPTIDGTAQVGQVLTVKPGDWAPAPVGLTYQWLADGTAVSGQTATTLTVTAALLGKKISVKVTGSRPGYTSASATSAQTAAVIAATMTAGVPTVSGTAQVGQALTAASGTWVPSDASFAYQWLADGTAVSGQTATTLTVTAALLGKKISVKVTGSRPGYTSASATSAQTAAVIAATMTAGVPTVSGTAQVGQALTAASGMWVPSDASFAYQWLADGTAISGATAASFTPTASELGKKISVMVTGSKSGYTSASATSAQTAAVIAAAAIVFLDVPPSAPFATEIGWMAAHGISTGYQVPGGREYRPYGNVSRDAMAAFLYRFAGSPAFTPPATSQFTDVAVTDPFYKEISWLASTGVTTGWDVGGGKREFRPYAFITRDAMAAFLYRFAGSPAFTPPATSQFTDVAITGSFYKEIAWLASTGVTTGWDVGGGKREFRPFANITRDAMAAFLYRYNRL